MQSIVDAHLKMKIRKEGMQVTQRTFKGKGLSKGQPFFDKFAQRWEELMS